MLFRLFSSNIGFDGYCTGIVGADCKMTDILSHYEQGITSFLSRLDKESAQYLEGLVYEQRLRENIFNTRQYGDTETLRHERTKIISELNELALATIGIEFNQLYEKLFEHQTAIELGEKAEIAPFQAPIIPPSFVGRQAEISMLDSEINHSKKPLVYGFHGMAGIGKTSLAAYIALQLRDTFKSGVLWYTLSPQTRVMDIMASFLRACGRPDIAKVRDIAGRSSAIRELFSSRKFLIVLDNVLSIEQVSELIPSIGKSVIILTSRDVAPLSLAGAKIFELSGLNLNEVISLFKQLLGDIRAEKEQDHIKKLAEIVGYLPLALDIAGRQLAESALLSIEEYNKKLIEKLGKLKIAHGGRSVQGVFEVSWEKLTDKEKMVFAACATTPGPTFAVDALVEIIQLDKVEVILTLGHLASLALVQLKQMDERYSLHPLLLDFSQVKLQERNDSKELLHRMILYYSKYLEQNHNNKLVMNSLELDRFNILNSFDLATTYQENELAIGFAQRLVDGTLTYMGGGFLLSQGFTDDAEHVTRTALSLSQKMGNVSVTASLHYNLGFIYYNVSKFVVAKQEYLKSLQLWQDTNNKIATARTLHALAVVSRNMSDYKQARSYTQQSLSIRHEIDDLPGMADDLHTLGVLERAEGNFELSRKYSEESLTIRRQLNDSDGMVATLHSLGVLARLKGDYDTATSYQHESLEIRKRIGDKKGMGLGYNELGIINLSLGNLARAQEYFEQSLKIREEVGDRLGQAYTLYSLGELAAAREFYEPAFQFINTSLTIRRELGDRRGIAESLMLIGHLHSITGDNSKAQQCLEESISIFSSLGDKSGLADALMELGLTKRLQGDEKVADSLLNSSLDIANQIGKTALAEKLRNLL